MMLENKNLTIKFNLAEQGIEKQVIVWSELYLELNLFSGIKNNLLLPIDVRLILVIWILYVSCVQIKRSHKFNICNSFIFSSERRA